VDFSATPLTERETSAAGSVVQENETGRNMYVCASKPYHHLSGPSRMFSKSFDSGGDVKSKKGWKVKVKENVKGKNANTERKG
jgi:hypothetical protein